MFLSFATPEDLTHLKGFWYGTNFSRDGVAYSGFLVPIFVTYFCIYSKSFYKNLNWLFAILISFSIYLGTISFVNLVIFNLPGVNYFRHLGLLFPIVKFYLIIVAAFGFKTFIENIRFENSKKNHSEDFIKYFYIFIFQFVMTVIFVLNKKINLNDIHYDHSRILIIFISIFFYICFF